MPFHMTVLGVYLGNEFSPASRDRMEIFGEAICEKVSKVSDLNLETSNCSVVKFVIQCLQLHKLLYSAFCVVHSRWCKGKGTLV